MRKILLILALFISAIGFSQENRNILTTTYNRAQVFNACENNLDWVKYPSYTDRAAWEKIPQAKRDATIAAGEKYLGFDWPNVLPSMYLEFTRTGNRAIVDNMISQRLTALRSLFYAELVEGKGRFIDDIINGVSLTASRPTGVVPPIFIYTSTVVQHLIRRQFFRTPQILSLI